MFVRTASERDLAAVRDLLVEAWHDTYDSIYGAARVTEITDGWHSLEALKARLTQPESEFLVADDGERIGGMVFATAAGRVVTLHQLYVLPAFQGRGIGSLLLDEIESCFYDADRLRLEVEDANQKAIAFYLGQGFARFGRGATQPPEGDGMSVSVYERPIAWME